MWPASRPAGTTTSSRTATCDAELDISETCVVNRDTTTTKKRATGKCIGASPSRAGRTGQRKGRGLGPSARAGSRRAGGWRCVSGRRCVKRGWWRWVRAGGFAVPRRQGDGRTTAQPRRQSPPPVRGFARVERRQFGLAPCRDGRARDAGNCRRGSTNGAEFSRKRRTATLRCGVAHAATPLA